jgi:hypothetical protein
VQRQLVVCLVLLSVSCSSSHVVANPDAGDAGESMSPGDADSGPVTPATPASGPLCARLSEILCNAEQRCCPTTTRTLERCRADLDQSCAQNLYLDDIASSPQTGFDADANASAVDTAFSTLEQLTLRCDVSITSWAVSDSGLRSIFPGTLERDQSCSPMGGASAAPGIVAGALSSCRHADGLACLPKSLLGSWSCAPKQATGGSCLTDDNCQNDSTCDNNGQPALGTCTARLPLGAACSTTNQCASLTCSGQRCAEADVQSVYCPAP